VPVRTTIIWRMMVKRAWITVQTATLSARTIFAFLVCGVVMGMMTVETALTNPPPVLRDTARQVTVILTHKPGGVNEPPPALRDTARQVTVILTHKPEGVNKPPPVLRETSHQVPQG